MIMIKLQILFIRTKYQVYSQPRANQMQHWLKSWHSTSYSTSKHAVQRWGSPANFVVGNYRWDFASL